MSLTILIQNADGTEYYVTEPDYDYNLNKTKNELLMNFQNQMKNEMPEMDLIMKDTNNNKFTLNIKRIRHLEYHSLYKIKDFGIAIFSSIGDEKIKQFILDGVNFYKKVNPKTVNGIACFADSYILDNTLHCYDLKRYYTGNILFKRHFYVFTYTKVEISK